MSDLPSSWPSCRLCINADAIATSYLAGLHRLFLEAKLAEKDHQTALQEANARAYEMETICLDPLPVTCTNSSSLIKISSLTCTQRSGSNSNDWTFGSYLSCKKSCGCAGLSTRWTSPRKPLKGSYTCNRDFMHQLKPTNSSSYRDLPGHILKNCPPSSAANHNSCCTTDQASPRCPTSAHGWWSTSPSSPSARLPTSPGCVLCRPPPPRRSRSGCLPSLCQVWPGGCVAHSGRNPPLASFAERGSPPTVWQVTLVQQKEFDSFEAHQTSRAIIPLTEAKANPPHSALRTDYACSYSLHTNCGAYMLKRGQKQPTGASPGRRRQNNLPRLTSSSESTTSLGTMNQLVQGCPQAFPLWPCQGPWTGWSIPPFPSPLPSELS